MIRPPIEALTPDIPDELLLRVRDVAAILACERTKASELLSTCTIPGAVLVGRHYRIPAGAVRAYLRDNAIPKNRAVFDLERQAAARRR